MISAPRPLHASDGAPLPMNRVLKALRKQFTVEVGPVTVVRRRHLDTFDHLLTDAGLHLEHHLARRVDQLVLTGATMPITMTAPAGADLRWPAMADVLVPGPLRDAVARASGIRALTVQSDQRRRVRRVELRNSDDKVVARLEIDEPAAPSETTPAPSLRVLALRGYDNDARRVTEIVTRAGLSDQPVSTTTYAEVFPPATRRAPMRQDPAATLLAQSLQGFAAAMSANLQGLIDDVDTEFLHDLRVAVRRTRSTLKLGRTALPDDMRTRWEPAFKWVGDLTTPVRDLDVYQLDLPKMASWLTAAQPGDLESFAEHLNARRSTARRTLLRGLRGVHYRTLMADWDEALAELASAGHEPDVPTAGQLSDQALSRAHRRVAKGGGAIDNDSPHEALHDMRKRCKELRYALEVFAPVLDPTMRKQAVADLKGLQDVLGRFQDSEVQRLALRDFAAEMMADGTSPAAVLAMGELIAHLEAEQARARREFEEVFARFERPENADRMRALSGDTTLGKATPTEATA